MTETYVSGSASIAGISLDLEIIEDDFEKSVAIYEYPYKNGANLEDMGEKARRIRLRCYFWDDNYDNHKALVNSLSETGLTELIHPKYGLVKGMISRIAVRHDDKIRTAEVDIDFIEQLRGKIQYIRRPDVKGETENAYVAGIEGMRDQIRDNAFSAIGAEATTICSTTLAENLPVLSQLGTISRKARAWVKNVDTFIAGLENELDAVENPANSLLASIEFATDLPGRVIGAVTRVAERYSELYESAKEMPEKFIQNMKDAMTVMATRLGFPDFLSSGFALQTGLDLGSVYSSDEEKRDTARLLEKSESFNDKGQYIKAESTPVLLTVNDIEKSLAIANGMIQDAVDSSRSDQALKDMANVLTEHAITIKIEREKLKAIYIDEELPLHLVCIRNGLPYNYAERLVLVNSIPNPNMVKGEILIYVR